MRNAAPRRNHRERAQPHERSKWGLLEKRKDYKLRAADHKTKQRKLKALQQKASERNEDEFYFGMMSSETKGGIKVAKRGNGNTSGGRTGQLSAEVVRLMKTQDVGYLRTVLQRTRREMEKVQEEVVVGEVGVPVSREGRPGRRRVFDEDGEDVLTSTIQPEAPILSDLEDDLSHDEDQVSALQPGKDLSPEAQRKIHAQNVRRRKLQALTVRAEELTKALEGVEEQRAKMNGTVGGTNKNGVTFKVRERKR